MTSTLSETLAKAEHQMLKEILREAESYLSAQLTSALAANQRAMTFTAVISAATAVTAGAAGSLLLSGAWRPLGVVCAAVACGFLFAIWTAMGAAAPSKFGFVGNAPSQWVADIEAGSVLTSSLAEQCAHYDSSIAENKARMEADGKKLLLAMKVVFWTMIVGGLAAIVSIGPISP